jgi:precorrin-6B methylase 2
MMGGERIVALELDARGMATNDATVELPAARTRTLVQGPDGNLYTANDAGEIWRIAAEPRKELGAPDVPFVPTPQEVVDAMLEVAKVAKGDVLYDLGSGDGRIPITAARRYGIARGVGIDINPERVKEAEQNRINAGVGEHVRFVNADLFETDLSEATVVTLYLLPRLNLRLLPKLLKELKPGTRIVSHAFDMGSWKPERTLKVEGRDVYFWTIPAPGTPSYKAAMAAGNAT